MVNVNKIKIIVFDLAYGDNFISDEVIQCQMFTTEDTLAVLVIDSPQLRYELEYCDEYRVYNLTEYKFTNSTYGTIDNFIGILEYSGINLDVDGILDIMLDETLDEDRKLILESVLYYKSNQEGKELNTHKIRVKHFDDLIHYFSEDFVSCEVTENNEDFSESEILMESYLTKDEINIKFNEYLINK